MEETIKLFEHQKKAINFFKNKDNCIFFMEMRTGKTYSALFWLLDCKKWAPSEMSKILIICPLSAKEGWKNALKALKIDGLYYDIVTPHGVRKNIKPFSYFCTILDEAQIIKNPKSKLCVALKNNIWINSCKHKIALTGTPFDKSYLELVNLFLWVYGIFMGCRSFWDFRRRFCYQKDFFKFEIYPSIKEKISRFIEENCYICSFVAEGEDTFKKNPSRNYEIIRQAITYKPTIETTILVSGIQKGRAIPYQDAKLHITSDISAMHLEQQILSGRLFNRRLKCKKLEVMQKIIEDNPQHKFLIFAVYVESILLLKEKISNSLIYYGGSSEKDRAYTLSEFRNNPAVKALICQVECVSLGMDLSVADGIIYYEQPQSMITRRQSEARPQNVNRVSPLYIYDLISLNTIEQIIFYLVKKKTATLSSIFTAWKKEYTNTRYFLEKNDNVKKKRFIE